jgi:hypothetical protein
VREWGVDDLLPRLILLCWGTSIVGWMWLVVLGFRHEGFGTGLAFFLVGPFAMWWGYRAWRRPTGHEKTAIPLFMGAGGLALTLFLILFS